MNEDINKKLANAKNPNSKEETLLELARDDSIYVREAVAKNPSSTQKVFEELLKKTDKSINMAIAVNDSCPGAILHDLAIKGDKELKIKIISNKNCLSKTFELLALDFDYEVRAAVAESYRCPSHVFELLSKDNVVYVKGVVVRNIECPLHILCDFSSKEANEEEDFFVVEDAVETLEKIIRNTNDPKVLEQIVDLGAKKVFDEIFRRSICPSHILDKYAKNKHLDFICKYYIAKNPNCNNPLPVYLDLLGYNESNEYYQKLKVEVRQKLIEYAVTSSNIDELRLLSKSGYDFIILNLIENPNCTDDILAELLNDSNPEVVKAVKKRQRKAKMYAKFKTIAGENKEEPKRNYILELIEKKGIEHKRKEKFKKLRKKLIEHFESGIAIYSEMKEFLINEKYEYLEIPRTPVPEEELFEWKNDHWEIKKIYQKYISQINFSFISGENLKVSGLHNVEKSNLVFDPQLVYNKDLRGIVLNARNVGLVPNFAGCNLCGTDLSRLKSCIGLSEAITDDKTIFPKNYRKQDEENLGVSTGSQSK